VDWELLDVRRRMERAIAKLLDGWHEPALSELVELGAASPWSTNESPR